VLTGQGSSEHSDEQTASADAVLHGSRARRVPCDIVCPPAKKQELPSVGQSEALLNPTQ